MNSFLELLLQDYPKRIAKDVLLEFNNPNENASSRWIWELMQNAKDCSDKGGIDVQIELKKDSISFSHNGKAFTKKDLIGLLTADSSKTPSYSDSDKFKFYEKAIRGLELSREEVFEYLSKTGKFGTGFMTTYLLSKEVFIKSFYVDEKENKYPIEISLDRNSDNLIGMEEKVDESFKIFQTIEEFTLADRELSENKQDTFTRFTYQLNTESSLQIAKEGLNNFVNNISMTMAFVDEINTVTVNDLGIATKYSKVTRNLVDDVYEVKVTINDKSEKILLCKSKNDIIKVGIPYVEDNGVATFINFKKLGSTQFISFPLINETFFDFPVAINCPLFNPTEPRDCLFHSH